GLKQIELFRSPKFNGSAVVDLPILIFHYRKFIKSFRYFTPSAAIKRVSSRQRRTFTGHASCRLQPLSGSAPRYKRSLPGQLRKPKDDARSRSVPRNYLTPRHGYPQQCRGGYARGKGQACRAKPE